MLLLSAKANDQNSNIETRNFWVWKIRILDLFRSDDSEEAEYRTPSEI